MGYFTYYYAINLKCALLPISTMAYNLLADGWQDLSNCIVIRCI